MVWNKRVNLDVTLNTVPYSPLSKEKEKDVRALFMFLNNDEIMWFEMTFDEHNA